MRLKWKLFGIAGLLAVVVPMTALAAAPDETTDFVLDLWNSRGHERRMRESMDAQARMNSAIHDVVDRISVKEHLIASLLADRVTFGEVVQRFAELNAGRPAANASLPLGYVPLNDEERAAYSVMLYVSARGNPVGSALPRLTREYEARFGRPYPREK